LEGIERLIELVSEKEMTLELLVARAAVQPQMLAGLRDGRHIFVRDVRERWFALFKAILLTEEARVIVRKVGLDGLASATTMEELADRCQLSVEETRQHGRNGLHKLRDFTNRHAVMACVTNSARLLLR
jgi:DNA-directed RNA polymerase sigma subunit (sigma70/sigma32)